MRHTIFPLMKLWVLIAAILAPLSAFAEPTVANEDSIKLIATTRHAVSVSEAQPNGKVGMVIDTLQNILQSVQGEEKEETEIYRKHMDWCRKEMIAVKNGLTDANADLDDAKVFDEEQAASIDNLRYILTKTAKELEETSDAIEQSENLRHEENTKYNEEMVQSTQSLTQIKEAIERMQKSGGFLQQSVEPDYVLGVMKGLRDKLAKSRREMQQTEEEKEGMHNDFMRTKGTLQKALGDEQSSKKIKLTETEAQNDEIKRFIGLVGSDIKDIAAEGIQIKESCEKKKSDWKIRQEDRTNEKAALKEAISYMKESLKSMKRKLLLEQQSSENSDDEAYDSVVFAQSFVQVASRSQVFGSDSDVAAAAESAESRTQKVQFRGLRDVVKELIARHQETQSEEKKERDFCEDSLAATEEDKARTVDALAEVEANIKKKQSENEMAKDEVRDLYKQIDDIRRAVEQAGKIRKQENVAYLTGTKDRTLALKILKQAKAVLQNFYDKAKAKKANLLQWDPSSSPEPKRKSIAAFGAVSMIQGIMDDMMKEQEDATIEENVAAAEFGKLRRDGQDDSDNKQQAITDRMRVMGKLKVQINSLIETREAKRNDLNAIKSQLLALHRQCDDLLKFFDQREKSRAWEISQLRDVKDVLSGSSIGARTGTGLVEVADSAGDEDPLRAREDALMKTLAMQ